MTVPFVLESRNELDLEAFAKDMIKLFYDGLNGSEIDVADIQDTLLEHGVCELRTYPEKCDEHCPCSELVEAPYSCVRRVPALDEPESPILTELREAVAKANGGTT